MYLSVTTLAICLKITLNVSVGDHAGNLPKKHRSLLVTTPAICLKKHTQCLGQ
jgi:hypothetical protein